MNEEEHEALHEVDTRSLLKYDFKTVFGLGE